MNAIFAAIHSHAESLLALRIFFSICLVIVILAGLYVFKNPQGFFRATQTLPRSLWRAQFAALAGHPGLDSRDRFVGHDALVFVRQTLHLCHSIQLRTWCGENEIITGSIRAGRFLPWPNGSDYSSPSAALFRCFASSLFGGTPSSITLTTLLP